MEKILICIDMQNDFVDGVLGTKEAQAILPSVVEKVRSHDGRVIFTRDTHQENYMDTQEGRKLPVPHCIEGTDGWQLVPALEQLRCELQTPCIDKPTFGSRVLAEQLTAEYAGKDAAFELIGVCTDICVISNAMLLKAFMPEAPVSVDSRCCAGVTPESHDNALKAMTMCQVEVL